MISTGDDHETREIWKYIGADSAPELLACQATSLIGIGTHAIERLARTARSISPVQLARAEVGPSYCQACELVAPTPENPESCVAEHGVLCGIVSHEQTKTSIT